MSSFTTTTLLQGHRQNSRLMAIPPSSMRRGRIAVPTVVHSGVRQALGVRAIAVDDIPADLSG